MKRISVALVGLILGIVIASRFNMLTVCAQEAEVKSLRVCVELEDYCFEIKWQKKEFPDGVVRYLYLPIWCKEQDVTIYFDGVDQININGCIVKNGEKVNCLKEGSNEIVSGSVYYELKVLYGSDIPVLHIKTESGNLGKLVHEKSYKEPGTASFIKNKELLYSGDLEYIKGRGNSTWNLSKKPFNIKYKEKTNLFDMGEAKKWCLLANYLDPTLLKNKLISDFADKVGIKFSAKSVIVDLYMNDQYMGNYTLMEKVEVDEHRVDITNLDKLNKEANLGINIKEASREGVRGRESYADMGSYKWVEIPNISEIITGGYLLEFELAAKYDSGISGFVSDYGQPIVVKSPEYAAREQVEYIKNYYQEFENALLSGDGYNEIGKHFTDYIDMASFAKMYVLQEFIKNLDAGLTSCYFYKDVGGKLVAAPAWDFDSGFGRSFGRNGVDMADPEGLWVTDGLLHDELNEKSTIFSLLCRHNEFRVEAEKQWEEYFEPKLEWLETYIQELWEINKDSIVADQWKWNDEVMFDERYNYVQENINTLNDFVSKRSSFVSDIFSEETCTIEYNSAGGIGSMYDLEFYQKGSIVSLQKNIYENGDREFLGWNTKISGYGDFYEDGESIVLNEDVTLYAQWSNPSYKEKIQKIILKIIGQ